MGALRDLAIAARRPFSVEALHIALAPTQVNIDISALEETQPGTQPRLRRGGRPSRDELLDVLERCGWNVAAAGRMFGRDRKQIYRWAQLHGIELKDE